MPAKRLPAAAEWRHDIGGPGDDDDAAASARAVTVPMPDPEPTEEESFIDRMRAVAAAQGLDKVKVKLYRRGAGSMLEWCRDYAAEEFEAGDLEQIRDEFGPGAYQVRIVGPKGIAMRENVSIAKPLSAPASQSTDFARVIEMLAQGQQRIFEAINTRPDPTAQMQQTLALMASMREAMGLNAAPVAAANPSAMLGDIVGAIRQLREVSAEISPPPAPAIDADNPMALLPDILGVVKAAMQSRADAPVPALMLPPSLAGGPEVAPQPPQMPDPGAGGASGQYQPPAEPQPNPDESEQEIMLTLFKLYASRLMKMAQTNAPIAAAADEVARMLPDDLFDVLASDHWFEALCAIRPDCAQHKDWLTAVREKVLADYFEDEPGDDEATPAMPPQK
jgi:hypothetical protein